MLLGGFFIYSCFYVRMCYPAGLVESKLTETDRQTGREGGRQTETETV